MAGEDGRGPVVVGVDGSDASRMAVRWAARRAARQALELQVVYAYGLVARYFATEAPVPPSVIETLLNEAQTIVDTAADEAAAVAPGLTVSAQAVDEPPVPALTHRSRDAVLVVLGASGLGGFTGMLAGSTAVAVAAHAHSPVVVVRCGSGRTEPPSTGPVVVGMDCSSLSERAVGWAFEEAQQRGAPLVAVHAWADVEDESVLRRARLFFTNSPEEEDVRARFDAQLSAWQAKYPDVEVERVLVRDRPRRQLLDRSERAQLVVVGSRGRGGFTGLLLGSTSQALIHHAGCPVMVVRPPKGGQD